MGVIRHVDAGYDEAIAVADERRRQGADEGELMALSVDPRWPRAGDWPVVADGAVSPDLALVGIPTHSTSLSATGADQTPSAVRAALRFYSEFTDRPLGVSFSDFGDAVDPDGHEDAAALLVSRAAADSRLVVTLGGDNSATVPAALGTWGSRARERGPGHPGRPPRPAGWPLERVPGAPSCRGGPRRNPHRAGGDRRFRELRRLCGACRRPRHHGGPARHVVVATDRPT